MEVTEYDVTNPEACPHCGGDEFSGEGVDVGVYDATQEVECLTCGTLMVARYKFVAWEW